MRKKIYLLLFTALLSGGLSAQIVATSALVPQYTQGKNSTNNNRTPFWFYVQLSGLTPGGTYRYFAALDSITAAPTSNGAGNPYLVNMLSSTFRRSTNATMAASTGHDSLTADVSGNASAWMGVEPTANGRFTPGDTLYPKIMFNNGLGGTTVTGRLLLSSYPVIVLNFGTTAGSPIMGSALYDSASVSLVLPKSFAALYDNVSFTGRPLSLAVVEDDGMYLRSIPAVANFYQTQVDSIPQRWGTIIPNANTNGVQGLQYFDFYNGAVIGSSQFTDGDGTWCSGAVTNNPANGTTGVYLNSTFNCSTGIKNNRDEGAILIMPNPNSGDFTLRADIDGPKTVCIYNALGKVIMTFSSSDKSISVSLGEASAGLYWVKITGANGHSLVQKVLVR